MSEVALEQQADLLAALGSPYVKDDRKVLLQQAALVRVAPRASEPRLPLATRRSSFRQSLSSPFSSPSR